MSSSVNASRLQLGRGFSAAESVGDIRAWAHGIPASIGPRLLSRGKLHGLYAMRGSVSASIGPRLLSRGKIWTVLPCRMPQRLLQLGRGFSAAESAQAVVAEHLGAHASIGPRLLSRGKHTCQLPRKSYLPRFNWAAASQPRKAICRWQCYRHSTASIGPRLLSRGKKRARGRGRQLIRFNWAAASQPRKAHTLVWVCAS